MLIESIGLVITVITVISTSLVFLLNKVVSKTKHETNQDNKIIAMEEFRNGCVIERRKVYDKIHIRIENLERRDTDREIMLAQINQKIEHVQTMIAQLTENQQSTFKALIESVNNIRS